KLRKNTTSGTGIVWVSARMSTFMPANAAPAMIMRAAPRSGAGIAPQRERIGAARASKDERITCSLPCGHSRSEPAATPRASFRADLRNQHPCRKTVLIRGGEEDQMTDAATSGGPLWRPSPERIRTANLTRFIAEAAKLSGTAIT